MPTVAFPKEHIQISVASGSMLIDAVRRAGLAVDAPCGGRGTCGKCKVLVLNGSHPGPQKSCDFPVTEDLRVQLLPAETGSRILEEGDSLGKNARTFSIPVTSPNIRLVHKKIPKATLDEPFSLSDGVRKALGQDISIPLPVMSRLYATLSDLDYEGDFLLFHKTLMGVYSSSKTPGVLAFDIGTTTIVSYLLDAQTGQQLSVSSLMNPQASYGADVISRCEYELKEKDGHLGDLVQKALATLAAQNAEKAGMALTDICFAVIAGNTCMEHLYLGISPESLVRAPYMATVNELVVEKASDLGLSLHPLAKAAVLPSIAGFVGGDTTAVLLSLPEDTFDKATLVLDIGTNGELVLGHGSRLFTCSTAAGPAFEGARISCGMRGAQGAIDHVSLKGSEMIFSVIGDTAPTGICGSGLIDLISCLLKLQILSSRGRINPISKWEEGAAALYKNRVTKKDGISAFLLTEDEEGIYLSQKDVREVQLAKAAISTGIEILCQKMGISVSDIQSVLLAGAFGTYMSPESACHIGLIPPMLLPCITGIGNAAGKGASLAALNQDALEKSAYIAKETRFVELASSKEFQTAYLNRLNF